MVSSLVLNEKTPSEGKAWIAANRFMKLAVLELGLSKTNPLIDATGLPCIKLITSINATRVSLLLLLEIKATASVAKTVILGLIFLCLKIFSSSVVKLLDKIAMAAFSLNKELQIDAGNKENKKGIIFYEDNDQHFWISFPGLGLDEYGVTKSKIPFLKNHIL